jgi:uncharacterized protein
MVPSPIEELHRERYINLETFKKNGEGVRTPVWFAIDGDRLVVFTDGTSYKVKRIRRDPRARVAACDVRGSLRGPFYDGRAEILEPGPAEEQAYRLLTRKYGWQKRLLDVFSRLGGRMGRRAVISIALDG